MKNFYKPSQPLWSNSGGNFTYREITPNENLQDLICCYWELKGDQESGSQCSYRVVADGCIDLFFPLENTNENYVMGFCDAFSEFHMPTKYRYLGVRFVPGSFPSVFNINAQELTGRSEPLIDVVKSLSQFIANCFDPADTLATAKGKFDTYFFNVVRSSTLVYDHRFQKALQFIIGNFANIKIEKDIDVGLSSRQCGACSHFM